MWTSSAADPASKESPPRHMTRLPNTNECGETWDDVFSSLTQFSNISKSMEEAAGSQQSDVGRERFDPLDHHVVSQQLVTEQILPESLVFVSLFFFGAFGFLDLHSL